MAWVVGRVPTPLIKVVPPKVVRYGRFPEKNKRKLPLCASLNKEHFFLVPVCVGILGMEILVLPVPASEERQEEAICHSCNSDELRLSTS